MIETELYDFLKGKAAVPVLFEKPERKKSEEYVVLEKTGGDENNGIRFATIAAQCYAPSIYRAAKLCEEFQEAMKSAEELDGIASIKPGTSYNFTDPETKEPRYQAVYEIAYY